MTMPGLGPIPQADPLGQPAPTTLLWALLLALFFLHLVAMNLMLGGALIGLVARWRSRRPNRPHESRLASMAAASLPVLIAVAVTLGVATLLFIQALYGRLFFTSSVLIGWYWLAVIPTLILAYGLAYRLAFRDAAAARGGLVASGVTAVALFAVACVYVNNMSLSIRPDRFVPIFTGDALSYHLNVIDPTWLPRLLHMVLGAVAVAGLAVSHVGFGRSRHDPEFGRWAIRRGSAYFAAATGLNLIAGIWWLAALPKETVLRFMGGNLGAALALAGGVILGISSLVLMTLAISARRPAGIVRRASVALVVTLVFMVLTRDQVRSAALASAGYRPAEWVAPQWGMMAVFAVLLVVALALIGGMVAALARGTSRAAARPATRPAAEE